MASINQDLLQALMTKLNLSQRQVYRLIQRKASDSLEELPNAALLFAQDKGIDIRKYTTQEERAILRGAMSNTHRASPVGSSGFSRPSAKTQKPKNVIINVDFILNSEIRRMISRDVAELNAVLSNGYEAVPKTCMILAGSIAETLLLDSLQRVEPAAKDVARNLPRETRPAKLDDLEWWDLGDMVNVAVHLTPRLLPTDALKMADQIREWRNLIHPGRELRDARDKLIIPTKPRAKSAIAFLELIADELGRNTKKNDAIVE